MKEREQGQHFEPRWPVSLAILAVIVLFAFLPGRVRQLPVWFPCALGIIVLIPIIAVGLTAAKVQWLRIERIVTSAFIVIGVIVNLGNLANTILMVLHPSAEVGGLQLLASSITVWVTNVLVFSILYWQMDRGGPESRVHNAGIMPDWLFPQEGASNEHVLPGWKPTFVDYLFLSYSTATAFSTTDVMPLSSRSKVTMMVESTISLVTIVVVASRAINILGS